MNGIDHKRETEMLSIAQNKYYKDYFHLKLEEVEKTEQEKFDDVILQLSR